MHTQFAVILATVFVVAGVISVSAVIAQAQTSTTAISGGQFTSLTTEITDSQIIITIDKAPGAAPVEPDSPIIIIPPAENETDGNATVIIPPLENVTIPGEPAPPANITIIEPDGNVTQVPEGNITQTPGDVTVIDPPAPEPCGCPPAGGEQPPAAVVPGGNDTTIITNETTVVRPDTEPGEESGNGGDGNGDGGNGGG